MVQEEIIQLLEHNHKQLSCREIAEILEKALPLVSRALSKLLQYEEVCSIEIDRKKAMESYKCKRRMRLYFIRYPKSLVE